MARVGGAAVMPVRHRAWTPLPGAGLLAVLLLGAGCAPRPPPGPAWQIDWRTATAEEVLRQIAAGQNVNAEAHFGETMLMQAAAATTDPAIIDAMVARGAKVEARNRICDYTVLMEAVTKNPCAEIAEALIRHGADVHARDDGGYSVLMLAAGRNPNPAVIDLLVRSGADPNAVIPWRFRGAGDSALWFACTANPSVATIECLIRNGARVGASDANGRSALFWASGYNTPAVVELLLKHGAGVNVADRYGETPLIRASWNTNALMTRLLLDHGARVDAADRHGTTALMRALWPGMAGPNAIQQLIERGADVNARDKHGRTPLMYGADACLATERGPDGIALLLAHGADARRRDARGQSAADRLQGVTNTAGRLALTMLAEAAGAHTSASPPTEEATKKEAEGAVVAFTNLQHAIEFLAWALETTNFTRIADACVDARRRPADHVLRSLQALHQTTPLRPLYAGRPFPTNAPTFKLGGHMSELGCTHIDFVQSNGVWRLHAIWVCR